MSAPVVALLAEAEASGVRLRVAGDGGVKVAAGAPPELLARLRERKAELVGLLTGHLCRHCGEPMGWPDPVGVMLDDGTALHHACREAAEVARVRRRAAAALSPAVLADPAELVARGELA